jgi:hypothetical protein
MITQRTESPGQAIDRSGAALMIHYESVMKGSPAERRVFLIRIDNLYSGRGGHKKVMVAQHKTVLGASVQKNRRGDHESKW